MIKEKGSLSPPLSFDKKILIIQQYIKIWCPAHLGVTYF